jgi:hypothetical protein
MSKRGGPFVPLFNRGGVEEDVSLPTPVILKHVRKRPAFWFWFIPAIILLGSLGPAAIAYEQTGWSATTEIAGALTVLIWIVVGIGVFLSISWFR